MKLVIEKTATLLVDTSIERKRINKAFKQDPTIQKKLNKLLDMVENQQWKLAAKEVDSKWWRSYDNKHGCHRLEFIGLINTRSNVFFANGLNYMDLIYSFTNYPKNYKVLKCH